MLEHIKRLHNVRSAQGVSDEYSQTLTAIPKSTAPRAIAHFCPVVNPPPCGAGAGACRKQHFSEGLEAMQLLSNFCQTTEHRR